MLNFTYLPVIDSGENVYILGKITDLKVNFQFMITEMNSKVWEGK